jgi:hypothetical protein
VWERARLSGSPFSFAAIDPARAIGRSERPLVAHAGRISTSGPGRNRSAGTMPANGSFTRLHLESRHSAFGQIRSSWRRPRRSALEAIPTSESVCVQRISSRQHTMDGTLAYAEPLRDCALPLPRRGSGRGFMHGNAAWLRSGLTGPQIAKPAGPQAGAGPGAPSD